MYYFVISTTFFSNYYKGTATATVATPAAPAATVKAVHFLRTFMDYGLHQ